MFNIVCLKYDRIRCISVHSYKAVSIIPQKFTSVNVMTTGRNLEFPGLGNPKKFLG